jgi:hypothetical protein
MDGDYRFADPRPNDPHQFGIVDSGPAIEPVEHRPSLTLSARWQVSSLEAAYYVCKVPLAALGERPCVVRVMTAFR